ncbi:MAG TPA: hypothetical protein VGC80_05510, partial [Acetobacteraceae bacterium]
MVLVFSELRSVVALLLRAIQDIEQRFPDRSVTIVVPELVEGHWWGYLMHTHRERHLRNRLLRYAGPNVAVASMLWHLQEAEPAEGIAEEEPAGV